MVFNKNTKNKKSKKNLYIFKKHYRKYFGGDDEDSNIASSIKYNNIIIYFLNNLNDYIKKNNVKQRKIVAFVPEMEHSLVMNSETNFIPELQHDFTIITTEKKDSLLSAMLLFLTCLSCHVLSFDKSIYDVILHLLEIISKYYKNEINTTEIISSLNEIIPCTKQFSDIFIILFNDMKAYVSKRIDIINAINNNIRVYYNNTKYALRTKIQSNFTRFRNMCSSVSYQHSLMSYLYSKQTGGIPLLKLNNYQILNNCNKLTTTELFSLYLKIKDYSNDEMKDILLESFQEQKLHQILKVLYISKYVINFIFKISISDTHIYLHSILDYIDCIISFVIAITMTLADTDKIKDLFVKFILHIMPKNKITNHISSLVNFIFIERECKM